MYSEDDPDEALTYTLVWYGETSIDNPAWLKDNAAAVYATIHTGLNSEYHYPAAVDAILSFVALLVADSAWKDWFEPIAKLVEAHPVQPGNPFQIGIREVIGEFRHLDGIYGNLAGENAIRVELLLKAYVKLFTAMAFKHGCLVPPVIHEQALRVADRLGDHIETSNLRQTLALYYTHYGDAEVAESYAKLAFNDSEFIEDSLTALNAGLTMATIYRDRQNLKRAEYFIARAIRHIQPGQRDKVIANVYYEYAAICYRLGKLDDAMLYYEHALSIYEEQKLDHHITMTRQAMAMVHIYQGDFAKAEAMLYEARSGWEILGNDYEWVNTFFVEADIEIQRGSTHRGVRMLRQTIDKAYTRLPDTPARETLIGLIQAHIEKYAELAAR